jgi:hypothetical protein
MNLTTMWQLSIQILGCDFYESSEFDLMYENLYSKRDRDDERIPHWKIS